jgi:hypothetical protein
MALALAAALQNVCVRLSAAHDEELLAVVQQGQLKGKSAAALFTRMMASWRRAAVHSATVQPGRLKVWWFVCARLDLRTGSA